MNEFLDIFNKEETIYLGAIPITQDSNDISSSSYDEFSDRNSENNYSAEQQSYLNHYLAMKYTLFASIFSYLLPKTSIKGLYLKAANLNFVYAQYNLALEYENDYIKRSARWCANKIEPEYQLGYDYYKSYINQSETEEIKNAWWLKAQEQIVPSNLAIHWHLKAAEQKYKHSEYHLCVIYEKLYDLEEAEKWCLKAEKQEHLEARYNLSKIYAYQKKWEKAKKFREKAEAQQLERKIVYAGNLWGGAYSLNKIK